MKCMILAGGSGTRLWPLSREQYAKQFLKIGGGESLLQKTVRRCLPLCAPADIAIVTNDRHRHLVEGQMREVLGDGAGYALVLEPESRNTAPAIALALRVLLERGAAPEETVVVLPSDHLVRPEEAFVAALRRADARAGEGWLVTFGVTPDRPETGYGYIKAGAPVAGGDDGFRAVARFVEKPDLPRAEAFLAEGGFFWNSGMCAFRIDRFFAELARHAPDIASLAAGESAALLAAFARMPNRSIDYAILEKSERVGVLPLDLAWSDVGSWDSVLEVLDKDERGNAKNGPVVAIDTSASLLYGRKRLIATIGVSDLLVIDTDDALLVARRGEAQRVREVVAALSGRERNLAREHVTTHRPWGTYTVLEESERQKIKRITVRPGAKLSLQMHHHRSEHWVVTKGTALVTLEGETRYVHENESIYVPKTTRHRLENPGIVPLEIIEVQCGEYVGEDDIVRFEDIYGRSMDAPGA